ncbi:hypothetical protein DYB30_006827 [Aphanomyces astaci]|uniref:Uncharacterized protein n=1 Tax=Aphanomyces astaci TaxID=112090 RepID=A0A397ALZ2_APHAT|nr:hypothetical protein DYB36_002928 [Aphanomyces astaci]RHY69955.1 hypothetical protein DYB30_006827 [Aphanomyces astaci]
MANSARRALSKYIYWTEDIELAILREAIRVEPFAADHGELLARWTLVAAAVAEQEPRVTPRAAREHVHMLLKKFKADDQAQRLSSGTAEEVTEKVQLLQDIAMRMDEVASSRTMKKTKETAKRDLLETTGEKLCREAEVRVAKRSRISTGSASDDLGESNLTELFEFEKKRHNDEHEYRMERLKLDREEQVLRPGKREEDVRNGEALSRCSATSMKCEEPKVQ